jgi:hypothetical protein
MNHIQKKNWRTPGEKFYKLLVKNFVSTSTCLNGERERERERESACARARVCVCVCVCAYRDNIFSTPYNLGKLLPLFLWNGSRLLSGLTHITWWKVGH